MHTVRLARHAMATRFEIVLYGEDSVALRAAGEEALNEVERLEAQLSPYLSGSEISHLNARAAREPVRVSPPLFALLQHAKRLSEETGGAFDITIAPLIRCWGFMGGNGRIPDPRELAEARATIGMRRVHLDPEDGTVRFERDGVVLDLGAIGKGYAVEAAAEILREAGVASALIHGGTSTVYALGRPPDPECWKVAIAMPPLSVWSSASRLAEPGSGTPNPQWTVSLHDEAMSVSAVWGKSFEMEGKTFGHVLDPRNGRPVSGAMLAAVVSPSAMETDALSTALLVLGAEGHDRVSRLRPGMRTLLLLESERGWRSEAKGISVAEAG